MINILSGVAMIVMLTLLWIMVRFSDWNEVMLDSEEEK